MAKFNIIKSQGNIKLGKTMGTISKLMGNELIYIDKLGTEVMGTCGGYCEGCKKACYVRKSYRYPSVKLGHARTTLAMRSDLMKAFSDMDMQLSRKRKPFVTVRINQSGELESMAEFIGYCDLARLHPETQFYLYTKASDYIVEPLLAGVAPDNITVLVSIWHEYGIDTYNMLKHLDNVKAFVYCDGYDYSQHGLEIQTMCHAYDENGKLDHDITCDKCKKCFNRLASCKVIGCNDH